MSSELAGDADPHQQFPPGFFDRSDETYDGLFYANERLVTHIKRGVIRKNGTNATHNRAGSGTQALHVVTRGAACNPLTLTVLHCNSAVKARGDLHSHVRPSTSHATQEASIQILRLGIHQPTAHLNARFFERRDSVTAAFDKRVLHCTHHICYTGCNQCFGARWRFAMVRTGLERDVGGRAIGLSRFTDGINFRMCLAAYFVPALADNFVVTHEYTTDHRVGMRAVLTASCKAKRTSHESAVSG